MSPFFHTYKIKAGEMAMNKIDYLLAKKEYHEKMLSFAEENGRAAKAEYHRRKLDYIYNKLAYHGYEVER